MLAAMHVTLEIPRDNDGGNFDLIGKQLFFLMVSAILR